MSSAKKRRELARANDAKRQAELLRSSAEVKAGMWESGCKLMQDRITTLESCLRQARDAIEENMQDERPGQWRKMNEALAAIDAVLSGAPVKEGK